MAAIDNYLQQAYETTANVRNNSIEGKNTINDWNDAWSNFMVNYALSEYEFGQNKEMWNLMNEYNSPQAQMQRFKEAGLNPMLIYQQGTNGNASSPVSYSKPNIQFTPNKHRNEQINAQVQQAQEIIGVVSNLVNNIASLYDQGLNIHLKQNEVLASDFNKNVMSHSFPYQPGVTPAVNYANIQETLNPLSSKFDPLAYLAFQKQGQLPNFFNNYLTADAQRALLGFKAYYQDYYNKNLLPKFNEYQQGKIDLQEIEKEIENYNKTSLEMIPAEWRGILEPVLDWISPFIKFIFKSSTVKHFVK